MRPVFRAVRANKKERVPEEPTLKSRSDQHPIVMRCPKRTTGNIAIWRADARPARAIIDRLLCPQRRSSADPVTKKSPIRTPKGGHCGSLTNRSFRLLL